MSNNIPCEDCISLPICISKINLTCFYVSVAELSSKCTFVDSYVGTESDIDTWEWKHMYRLRQFFEEKKNE